MRGFPRPAIILRPLPDAVIEILAEQALKTGGRRPQEQDVMRAMARLVEAEVGSPFALSDAAIDALLLLALKSSDARAHPTRAFVRLIEFELQRTRGSAARRRYPARARMTSTRSPASP